MKKLLILLITIVASITLFISLAVADCWDWSISETTLAVTLKGHTPNTAENVTVPDWYYPSNQSTRDAIQAVINALRTSALFGQAGYMAVVNAYESTGGLPVTAIGEYAFDDHANLKYIYLPESVNNIGAYAFFNCYALELIDIPQGVSSINEGTFASCNRLWDVTLPYGLTSIGKSAFESCLTLESIYIPDTVTDIGYAAFSGCNSLQSLRLEEGLQSISDYAFYVCDHLEWIQIPNSVTYIGDSAFYGSNPVVYTSNDYVINFARNHGLQYVVD